MIRIQLTTVGDGETIVILDDSLSWSVEVLGEDAGGYDSETLLETLEYFPDLAELGYYPSSWHRAAAQVIELFGGGEIIEDDVDVSVPEGAIP